MAQFMDIHSGFSGVTKEQLEEAHRRDQALERQEGVHFVKAWADPTSGKAFCLSEGPNKEAIARVHQQAGHPTNEIYEVSISVE